MFSWRALLLELFFNGMVVSCLWNGNLVFSFISLLYHLYCFGISFIACSDYWIIAVIFTITFVGFVTHAGVVITKSIKSPAVTAELNPVLEKVPGEALMFTEVLTLTVVVLFITIAIVTLSLVPVVHE